MRGSRAANPAARTSTSAARCAPQAPQHAVQVSALATPRVANPAANTTSAARCAPTGAGIRASCSARYALAERQTPVPTTRHCRQSFGAAAAVSDCCAVLAPGASRAGRCGAAIHAQAKQFSMQRLTPPSLAALDFGEASFLQWRSTLVKTVLTASAAPVHSKGSSSEQGLAAWQSHTPSQDLGTLLGGPARPSLSML